MSDVVRHPSFRSMNRYALDTYLNRAERGNPNEVWFTSKPPVKAVNPQWVKDASRSKRLQAERQQEREQALV